MLPMQPLNACQVARYSWDSWPSALLVLVCPEPHLPKGVSNEETKENWNFWASDLNNFNQLVNPTLSWEDGMSQNQLRLGLGCWEASRFAATLPTLQLKSYHVVLIFRAWLKHKPWTRCQSPQFHQKIYESIESMTMRYQNYHCFSARAPAKP